MGISLDTRIQRVKVPKGRRMLAVSDIHGHGGFLKELLLRAEFSREDILFIAGDIVEKGPDSLDTLRYVMELCESHQVYPTIGNIDRWRVQMIEDLSEEGAERLRENIPKTRRDWGALSLFEEMCLEIGASYETGGDVHQSQIVVLEHFKKELDFLRSLPTIVETQNYIFVHAGIPHANLDALEGTQARPYIKLDAFLDLGLSFPKWVVVGHWPVATYNSRLIQANPIILPERKIISMDGGCGMREDGQLNLLITPDIDAKAGEIHHLYYDDLFRAEALDAQEESEESVNIRFFDNEVEVLKQEAEFCFVRHVSSKRELWVPQDILWQKEGHTVCGDFSNYHIKVEPGELLSVIRSTSKGFLVKKAGVSGWYEGRMKGIGE